ncbi:cytidylyltransferase domain-containing protein [Chloroflexota bacterium]
MSRLKEAKSFKTGIFITARLKSTRLPLKVIKPILGRPMVEWMIERLKRCNIEPLVMMTSTNPQDDPLVEIAGKNGITYFRGSEGDVLLRMRDCARQFDVDLVVSITADNPLVEPVFIEKMIDRYSQTQFDFCEIKGLPIGCFSYTVSRNALEKVFEIKDSSDTEIWGPYFKESGLFKCDVIEVTDPRILRSQYRLTVDTSEDFELVNRIFEILGKEKEYFNVYDICQLLDENEDLVKINAHIEQISAPQIELKQRSRKGT